MTGAGARGGLGSPAGSLLRAGSSSKFRWRECFSFVGPGFLMAIAYIDPGNFESDLAAGAQFEYSLLWVLLLSTAMGWLIQILTVLLAITTGLDLAQACRHEYPRPIRLLLWILAEMTIIASDIPEVIGTAFALKMLFGLQVWMGVILTGFSVMVFLLINEIGYRAMEVFFAGIVSVISLCYLVMLFYAQAPAGKVLQGLFSFGWFQSPVFSSVDPDGNSLDGSVYIAVSLLGALVMPHNLFLHSSLSLARDLPTSKSQVRLHLLYNTLESGFALLVSLFINVAVVITAVATVQRADLTEEERYTFISQPLQHAPEMLTFLGRAAKPLFGVALLASGQSSTMTGTLAGQYVMEGFVELKFSPALRAFLTRMVAIIPSLVVTLVAGESGSEALIKLCSVILSFQLPFALIPLIKFVMSEQVMGDLVLKRYLKYGALLCSACVVVANLVLLPQLLFTTDAVNGSPLGIFIGVLCGLLVLVYVVGLVYISWRKVSFQLGEVAPDRWTVVGCGGLGYSRGEPSDETRLLKEGRGNSST